MIKGIVAIDKNYGIGLNGQLPWPYLKEDLDWFKNKTSGHVVVMGSTTFKSLSKPLPNRINLVLSRSNIITIPEQNVFTFLDPVAIFSYCEINHPEKDIYIIGGSEIYKEYMNFIESFYVTEIDESYECDKFFDFSFVKTKFKNVVEHATYTSPVNFKIKEYIYEPHSEK